jgi:nicotinate-nucleotide adenylyltransferase
MSQRLAIFGGTFNPIHRGHVTVLEAAVRKLGLDRVMLIPSAVPPHKASPELAAGEDRLAMCRLAMAESAAVEVSDLELRRAGPSYTIDTVREVRRLAPEAELFLIVGADMLRDFHLWRQFAEIAGEVRLITLPRPGVEIGRLAELRAALGDKTVDGILADVQATPLVDVSSTEIRQRLRAGRAIDDLVPAAVAEYIRERGLYRY